MSLSPLHDAELSLVAVASLAARARAHCIDMAAQGGAFLGASLSSVDILALLYGRTLRIAPALLEAPERDVFLLSKGHAVPALYGVLAERGYFPAERLALHLRPHSGVYWHPNPRLPGVEFAAGSLGHLLSFGVGVALDMQLRATEAPVAGAPAGSTDSCVVVLLGDGELNEGSVWEAVMVARAHKLGRLIAIVDRNGIQANVPTEALVPLEPLADKFRSFGWQVVEVDGHDLAAMDADFSTVMARARQTDTEAPTVVIAHTCRGKGLPSHEGRVDRWYVELDAEGAEALQDELKANTLAGAG